MVRDKCYTNTSKNSIENYNNLAHFSDWHTDIMEIIYWRNPHEKWTQNSQCYDTVSITPCSAVPRIHVISRSEGSISFFNNQLGKETFWRNRKEIADSIFKLLRMQF